LETAVAEIIRVDSRRRVTLSNAKPGEVLRVEVLDSGVIVLTPVVVIDKRRISNGVLENGDKIQIIEN
jgi:hypothetical protein